MKANSPYITTTPANPRIRKAITLMMFWIKGAPSARFHPLYEKCRHGKNSGTNLAAVSYVLGDQ